MTIAQELDQLTTAIKTTSKERNYWLVRLIDPISYENAIKNGILEYEDLVRNADFSVEEKLSWHTFINEINNAPDIIQTKAQFKKYFNNVYDQRTEWEREFNTASVDDFFKISKKDDIVVLDDSEYSQRISIGFLIPYEAVHQENEEVLINKSDVLEAIIIKNKIKKVIWIDSFDTNRFKTSSFSFLKRRTSILNNIVTDLNLYSLEVELLINDIIYDYKECTYVIRIDKEFGIKANKLFGFGKLLLDFIDLFSKEHNLGFNSEDLDVSIVINSPGIIKLKSKFKSLPLLAALIVLVVGGGYENKNGTSFKTPGLIKCLDEFFTHKQEREIKAEVFRRFKNSLKIKDSDELLRLIKQFSENKDIPK